MVFSYILLIWNKVMRRTRRAPDGKRCACLRRYSATQNMLDHALRLSGIYDVLFPYLVNTLATSPCSGLKGNVVSILHHWVHSSLLLIGYYISRRTMRKYHSLKIPRLARLAFETLGLPRGSLLVLIYLRCYSREVFRNELQLTF